MDQTRTLKQTVGIPDYYNLQCDTLGLDSFEHCFDKKNYNKFPKVVYKFNSLGYRTNEEYSGNEILVVGDSFTLGLGVNIEDTWPAQLSKLLNYPVLNFSLNGASNDWIARRAAELLDFFNPKLLIVHYSFSHRREKPFPDWHDNERTECEPIYTDSENFINWQNNFKKISNLRVPLIHSFIPNWHTSDINYTSIGTNVIPPIGVIDLARDGFHYGPATNRLLATTLLARV
jgi:hypothetical protein